MARNKVQFQKGMSEAQFDDLYGSEALCHDALVRWRWPEGFECPDCEGRAHCIVKRGVRILYQCNGCRKQTSVTAGTIFASSKLPLRLWFKAMYLLTQSAGQRCGPLSIFTRQAALPRSSRKTRQETRRGPELSAGQEAHTQKLIVEKRPEQLKMEFALWTRAAMGQLIEREFKIALSVRGVGKYLKRRGFTPQKPIRRAYERDRVP